MTIWNQWCWTLRCSTPSEKTATRNVRTTLCSLHTFMLFRPGISRLPTQVLFWPLCCPNLTTSFLYVCLSVCLSFFLSVSAVVFSPRGKKGLVDHLLPSVQGFQQIIFFWQTLHRCRSTNEKCLVFALVDERKRVALHFLQQNPLS